MNKSKADLLLHPTRMRIIQTLLTQKEVTATVLAEFLPDISQATLYRQLNILLKGNMIYIVAESQKRGTLEKTYSLIDQMDNLTSQEIEALSKDDHMKFFMTFTAHLLRDFENYLEQGEIDLMKDGVSYRQASLFLSDTEFMELGQEMGSLISRYLDNKPNGGRRMRKFSTIVIPEKSISDKG